ncbi:MAG: serine/threonine protein kinase [Proteobacteria bacterium]|nr:serine/threonine protein kinase [Pseudomonadota bacterium]
MKQPETFGKFLLYGQVAVGGMAEIYKGRYADPSAPQADIAIKRILPSYTEDESFVTMFKDEGNIALRLQHPNIVRVYEVGEVNNDWYIAMEFIHGTDLRVLSDQCEKNNKRFTTTQVARIICETAKALDYAHACKDENGNNLNIVHRDCTPHNIMVTMDGQVKLMDFGIAKAASRATKTRVGTVKGKSSYMSPEQAKGQNLDGRSDMFTLGTVGWEMLTGHRLFKASSDRDAILKILKTPTVHPSDLDANVPRELGDIIMLTLQKDRDMRYATCGQLANALEQYISQHGDGSDQSLGIVVQALLNKNGHRIAELPDYVPGYSKYEVTENGDFNLKDSAPASAPQPMPMPQPMASQPMMAPVSNATYPGLTYDPTAASALPQPKPWGLIIGSVLILLLGAIFIGGALYFRSIEVTPNVTFTYPESRIKIKSKPDGATITLNDQKLDGKTPHSYKAKLGEAMEIKFELDGYEPVTIKREARLLDQTVSVDLMTIEEAQLAKMDAFKALIIKTTPEDAKVIINGEDKGKAPVTLENVKFGTKLEIEVEADGYESENKVIFATKDLESKNGEVEQLIELAAATTKGGKHQPAKKADNAKPKQPKKPAQAAESGSGTLTVKAKPWAIVSIDGARVGNTPISKRKLKAGSHKVELNHPAKQKKVNKTINLKNNQNLELNYDFNADKWL